MNNIIIGNIISFIAALFMISSCIVNDRSRVFMLQFFNSFLLGIASWFFASYAGIAALLISSVRNFIVSKDKFTKNVMIVFLILSVTLGVAVNNRGFIGLIPIIATVQYTLCSYYVKGVKETRYSIWANLFMWIVYSFSILDFSTALSDSTTLIINTISIIKHRDSERSMEDIKENITFDDFDYASDKI
ncbi:YgjV family protein [Anaerofustis stercorihominis]|uniref:YgjV family protein n=1 Tax=Anaerofustis stercorihominis TaxID=214853 RepID=A0A3E3DXW8_9FIRM|nr:YgjV family protein [Anaerofustis stercorihominis]RGD74112.1 hypothetical protein DW687_04920 [Anaerofustis stercorihominis]